MLFGSYTKSQCLHGKWCQYKEIFLSLNINIYSIILLNKKKNSPNKKKQTYICKIINFGFSIIKQIQTKIRRTLID